MDLVSFLRRGHCSEVSEAVLGLAPNERVIRNATTPCSSRTIRTNRRGPTPLLTSSFSVILICAFRADVVHQAACTLQQRKSVLLAVALYAINTAILGRRIPTATSPDKRNAYNPLNR